MRIEFVKMQGLANDFLVFDAPAGLAGAPIDPGRVRALADRHTGVGFDQALMLEAPRDPRHRVFYRIFNADGGEVEQCGNGARCVAALLYARAPQRGRELVMESKAGPVYARVRSDGSVSVDMGEPAFAPASIPLDAPAESSSYSLEVGGEILEFGAVSIGNPHAVLHVESVDDAPVERIGRALQSNVHFPKRVNVGFMQVIDTGHIRLRVYERGAGETRACGTGACAAAVVGHHLGLLGRDVEVRVPGGALSVHWGGPGQSVWLTGPAQRSYEGRVEI